MFNSWYYVYQLGFHHFFQIIFICMGYFKGLSSKSKILSSDNSLLLLKFSVVFCALLCEVFTSRMSVEFFLVILSLHWICHSCHLLFSSFLSCVFLHFIVAFWFYYFEFFSRCFHRCPSDQGLLLKQCLVLVEIPCFLASSCSNMPVLTSVPLHSNLKFKGKISLEKTFT